MRLDMTKVLPVHPAPSAEQLAEAGRLTKESAGRYQAAEDSFQRCDTDGFLSQWASNLHGQLYREQAEILRNGGYAEFTFLIESAGDRVVNALAKEGDFGTYWSLTAEEAGKFGRRFVPYGGKSRIQKNLGLHQEKRWYPAYAKIAGRGKGLNGSAWVQTFMQGEE